MNLPQTIRDARTKAGMSQQALASTAGLATGTIARIERGEDMTINTLTAIANALGIPLADLVT